MSTGFGTDPALQTVDPFTIKIMYKTEFEYFCCSQVLYDKCNLCLTKNRKYFYILENAYETNQPVSFCNCCRLDMISKAYFDRGIFTIAGCDRSMGCTRGDPSVYSNYSRYVCCCIDCPDIGNQCLNGYFPSMCGDRVMVLQSEYHCCCLPTRSCWLHNCCGLCGIKSGDPFPAFSYMLIHSLAPGKSKEFVSAMDSARGQWKARLASQNIYIGAPASALMVAPAVELN